MIKNYKHIIIILSCFLLWTSPAIASVENSDSLNIARFTSSKDSVTTKKSDTINTTRSLSGAEVNPLMARWQKEKNTVTAANAVTQFENKKFKSFPELDNYTKNLYLPPNDGVAEFTQAYLEQLKNNVDNNTKELIGAAEEVFDIIERNQRFIKIIGGQEIIEMPVGIKQAISENSSISLGIISMEYHPDYTVVDMFAKIELAELGGEELFFAANDVKISRVRAVSMVKLL